MKTLIVLGVLMLLSIFTMAKSLKPFPRKGWLCLVFSYAALWVTFFSYGFKWWILLITGILVLTGIIVWVRVESENNQFLENAQDARDAAPELFNALANKISGENSFAQGFFGSLADSAANAINAKLDEKGFFNARESDDASYGRAINKVGVFGSLICIVVSYFLND